MRWPQPLQRYADRVDAMSLRERVLIFLAVAVTIVLIVDSALFEPVLRRQKISSQRIQQQQDEIRTMQTQVQAYAQARTGDNADVSAKQQRLEKGKLELAALDRQLAAKQGDLVPPERMAKMLSEIVKRNPDIELVSLRTLAATGLSQSLTSILGSTPGGLALYRHGIEIAVSGSYLKMLNYVGQLERLPAKIVWGNMELQAGAYPVVTLKITLYTFSPEKSWLLI
jgi:MSHA biogenesis protein MshJ